MHHRISGCLLFVLLVVSCSGAGGESSIASNRIVYGLTLTVSGIDPHVNQSSELGIPLRQVYDTLVYRDPATKAFVPGLASEWTISEDGLLYTFNLKEGVRFHDGTAFNAQAVAANLDRITNPETASQKAVFMLGTYQSYEIIDDYSIRLILSAPYSPLLDSLSQVYLGVASPKALSEYSLSRYQFHQVGTGPFIFADYIPGDRIVLRRNLEYSWGPAFYQQPTEQSLQEIEFRFFTDEPTRALAVSSNGAQAMGELTPIDARGLIGNSALQLVQVSVPGQPLQFLMNTQRFPTDNLAVRQALILATNRSVIIDTVYQGFSPVAWGPLSANTLYFNRDLNGLYAQDTTQAQTLLANAGYQDTNADGILDIGGIDLEVTVIVPPWGRIPDVAQLIQDQWRTIGIRVNLEAVPTFTALNERVRTDEYNLVAFYTFGLDPALLNAFFLSDGVNNWTKFSRPDLDDLLRQAVRETDENIRRNLYAQVQKIIMDEALILPIRDYVNLNALQVNLQNVKFDAYGWFPILNNATLTATGT